MGVVIRRWMLVVLGCLGFSGVANATPITYELFFDDGNSNTLQGYITTDGTIGALATSNFVAASFTALGSPSFDFDIDFQFQSPSCSPTPGCLFATPIGLFVGYAQDSIWRAEHFTLYCRDKWGRGGLGRDLVVG